MPAVGEFDAVVDDERSEMGPREREVMAMDFDGDGRDAALHLDEAREDDAAERLTGFDRGAAAVTTVTNAAPPGSGIDASKIAHNVEASIAFAPPGSLASLDARFPAAAPGAVVVSDAVAADWGLVGAPAGAEAKLPDPQLRVITDAMGIDTRVERENGLVLLSLTGEDTGALAALTPDEAETVSNWLRTQARAARKFAAVEARANAAADAARAAVFKRSGLAK